MFREFLKKNVTKLEVLFLICISFIPLIWFSPEKLVFGLDSGYPFDFIGYFWQRSFTWLSSANFGVDMSTYMGLLPFHSIQALIRILGVSFYDVEKVTFIFWFFVMSLSMYLLIRYLYSKPKYWTLRILAVLLYVVNFYLYSFWLNGEQTTFAAYSLLPLSILLLLRFLREETTVLKSAVLLNIVFFFLDGGGITGIPVLGSTLLAIVTLLLFFFAVSGRKKLKKNLTRLFRLIALSSLIFFFLNAFWLLPFVVYFQQQFAATLQVNGGSLGANINWVNFISRHASFLNLFRLQGDNNWYNHPGFYSEPYFSNFFLIIGSFILPILAIMSTLLVKEKREKFVIGFLFVLTLLGFFLSAGSHAPFGSVYVFLMAYLPGFIAYRSAYYKFIISVYFTYSILISISLYYLLDKLNGRWRYSIWVLLVIAYLSYNFPFFQSKNFVFQQPFTTMVHIPSYVKDFAQYEKLHQEEGRTLVLPPVNFDYPLHMYTWGYYSAGSLFPLLSKNSFIEDRGLLTSGERSLIDEMYASLEKKDYSSFLKLASILDVKNILITNDVVDNYANSTMESPQVYVDSIRSSKDFNSIWHEGKWELFSIPSITTKEISIAKSVDVYKGESSGKYIKDMPNPLIYLGNSKTTDIGTGSIVDYPCTSCVFFKDDIGLALPSSLITPGSFFYRFKEDSEKKNLAFTKDPLDRANLLLDLSLKRTSELHRLLLANPRKTTPSEWEYDFAMLSAYWKELKMLDIHFQTNGDFIAIKTISNYGNFLVGSLLALKDTSYSVERDRLNSTLQHVISDIENTIADNQNISRKYRLQNVFVYKLPKNVPTDLYVSKSSLLTDNGVPLLPSSIEGQNNSDLNYTMEGNLIHVVHIPTTTKSISIYYNFLPNGINSISRKKVVLPNQKENCLVIDMKDYSIDDTYVLSANIENNSAQKLHVDLYTVGDHPVLIGENPQDRQYNFPYERNYEQDITGAHDIFFQFKGYQDDTKLTAYLCVNQKVDPATVFGNIQIIPEFEPYLFSGEEPTVSGGIPESPIVTYSQKDPTSYMVTIRGAKVPFILTFLQRYSPKWQIVDAATGNDIKTIHGRYNGYANAWKIDKKGNFQLEITFAPQHLFIVGAGITLVSLIILLGIIIYIYKRNEK